MPKWVTIQNKNILPKLGYNLLVFKMFDLQKKPKVDSKRNS